MASIYTNLLFSLLVSLTASAVPTSVNASPAAITAMSGVQINAFTPYTHYASTAFCSPSVTKNWTCGVNCKANPKFNPIDSGGDGTITQFWYVGYDPTLHTIIVTHQGTAASKILPILTDADIILVRLSSPLFPSVPAPVRVHSGFMGAHARAADAVLAAVKAGVETYGTKSVTTVGHSLGAAISLLDAVFLPLHIPDLAVTFYGYGLPRVGNKDFANYVDGRLGGRFTRITNFKDPVPTLPGRFLGYKHPSSEAHIDDGKVWKWCPGQDNTDKQCSIGDVPNIFEANPGDHNGPYNGITMGC